MQLNFGKTINVGSVDPTVTTYEPVESGWYVAMPVEIDAFEKAWGTGLKVQFKITEGPLKGRAIFDNCITLQHNTSAQAHDIGQRKLAQWCLATGTNPNALTSAEPFLNKVARIKVAKKAAERYRDRKTGEWKEGTAQNRVDAFAAYDGMPVEEAPASAPARPAAPAPTPATVPVAVAAAGPGKLMPWQTKR